jgi:hypothetical protein
MLGNWSETVGEHVGTAEGRSLVGVLVGVMLADWSEYWLRGGDIRELASLVGGDWSEDWQEDWSRGLVRLTGRAGRAGRRG